MMKIEEALAGPLVSIIVPTYNRANTIINCLNSVINQTYLNIQIIVVDDGSKDNTEDVIQAYIVNNSLSGKLIYYKQENRGAPAARNLGLERADGDLIVFFDSDDIMLPTRLQKQVYLIEVEHTDCCACGFLDTKDGKEYIPELNKEQGAIGSLIYWRLMGSTQCWMYKKNILLKVGGYHTSYIYYDDWFLTFRFLVQSEKVSVVKESLSIFVNDERLDRLTLQFQDAKRIPYIQAYYLELIKWLAEQRNKTKLLDHVIFLFVSQITIHYYKTGPITKAYVSYNSFSGEIKNTPLFFSLRCRVIFVKHLIKILLKYEFIEKKKYYFGYHN